LIATAATLPAPPGRLSMMIVCFMFSEAFWATRRMTTSELPPAANGTRIVIGRLG
jgi:hypothetical protein